MRATHVLLRTGTIAARATHRHPLHKTHSTTAGVRRFSSLPSPNLFRIPIPTNEKTHFFRTAVSETVKALGGLDTVNTDDVPALDAAILSNQHWMLRILLEEHGFRPGIRLDFRHLRMANFLAQAAADISDSAKTLAAKDKGSSLKDPPRTVRSLNVLLQHQLHGITEVERRLCAMEMGAIHIINPQLDYKADFTIYPKGLYPKLFLLESRDRTVKVSTHETDLADQQLADCQARVSYISDLLIGSLKTGKKA